MKTIKLFAFLMAMAIAMPAAAQVKVLGKSGNTSTTTAKKTTTTTAKKSAAPKASSSSYGSDYSNEGWQGGVGIVYQIADNFNAFGLHARVLYGINEEMRLSLMDEFYFKDGLSYLDNLDFDFHYLFNVADNIHIYPFGGATIQLTKSKDVTIDEPIFDNNYNYIGDQSVTYSGESMSAFGLNLGCGVQYAINDQIAISAEAKYRFYFKEHYKGQFVLGAGLIYHF
jgi:outer membrane protein X